MVPTVGDTKMDKQVLFCAWPVYVPYLSAGSLDELLEQIHCHVFGMTPCVTDCLPLVSFLPSLSGLPLFCPTMTVLPNLGRVLSVSGTVMEWRNMIITYTDRAGRWRCHT